MAKFTTEKTQEFKEAQHAFTDFSVHYVKTWTKKELGKYINRPIVITHGDHGFFVGAYEIAGHSKNCWRVTQKDGKLVGDFFSKAAAIFYCLCSVEQKFSQAAEIFGIDNTLGKLSNDLIFYEKTLKATQKNKNDIKFSIVLNRYIDTKFRRKEYLNLLKKTLISAKYMKFGK